MLKSPKYSYTSKRRVIPIYIKKTAAQQERETKIKELTHDDIKLFLVELLKTLDKPIPFNMIPQIIKWRYDLNCSFKQFLHLQNVVHLKDLVHEFSDALEMVPAFNDQSYYYLALKNPNLSMTDEKVTHKMLEALASLSELDEGEEANAILAEVATDEDLKESLKQLCEAETEDPNLLMEEVRGFVFDMKINDFWQDHFKALADSNILSPFQYLEMDSSQQQQFLEKLSEEELEDPIETQCKQEFVADVLDLLHNKMNLEEICKDPDWHIGFYGSSQQCKIDFKDSDRDMTIVSYKDAVEPDAILLAVEKELRKLDKNIRTEFLSSKRVRVPLLKLSRHTSSMKVPCCIDITINNVAGINNSELFKTYFSLDHRVWELYKLVRIWSKRKGINNSRYGYYSDYAMRILVIFYLQQVVSPPVLPCLTELATPADHSIFKTYRYKAKGVMEADYINYGFEHNAEKLDKIMKEQFSANHANLISLFEGFLHYYGIDYLKLPVEKKTISIEKGEIQETPEEARYNLFAIQDAFDSLSFVGGSVNLKSERGLRKAAEITKEFTVACKLIQSAELPKVFEKKYD
jgi:DNA polymerase sigma